MMIARGALLLHGLAAIIVESTIALSAGTVQPNSFTAEFHKTKGVGCEQCHDKAKRPTFVPSAGHASP